MKQNLEPLGFELPARNLADVFNACDPSSPLAAGDPRWVDLSPGRGDKGDVVRLCRNRILRSRDPLVQLLAGHRGCGKSTELRRLAESLRADRYFVARFEVDQDLDFEDTQIPDILLAIVRNLEARMREANLQLDEKLIEDFMLWFAEVVLEKTDTRAIEAEVRTELGVGANVPLFAKLLARFTGWIKTGTESKQHLRRKLDPQISQLVERGRTLVTAARLAVKAAGYKDLVVIVDNLDRIVLKDQGDGRTSYEVLFVERGEVLKEFRCHLILTVPIPLVFSPKLAHLNAIFPDRHILAMVKVASKGARKPWTRGREVLGEVLRQRIDTNSMLEAGAESLLIDQSGGHARQLLTLIRYALDFIDEPPITRDAARKAAKALENDYGRSIPEHHWELLARVRREQSVLNDEDHQLMLFNLSVLEYQNEERWCDVNPVILGLPAFEAALAAYDGSRHGHGD